MNEQVNKENLEENTSDDGQALAKIEPVKVEVNQDIVDDENVQKEDKSIKVETSEKSLILSVRALLREHGVRKSAAAIRDAVEMPHEVFAPKQAVSAVSSLGFKASFGNLSLSSITSDFYPALAFEYL